MRPTFNDVAKGVGKRIADDQERHYPSVYGAVAFRFAASVHARGQLNPGMKPFSLYFFFTRSPD
jgi:hypothetical protein